MCTVAATIVAAVGCTDDCTV